MNARFLTAALCSICSTPTTTVAFIAQARPDAVRCREHGVPVADDPAPTVGDLWDGRVPADVRGRTLADVPSPAARRALAGIAAEWPNRVPTASGAPLGALVLAGPSGTRKTTAAYAFVSELVRSGRISVREILSGTETQLALSLAPTSPWERQGTWRELLRGKQLVLLDDVGYAIFPSVEHRIAIYKDLLDQVMARDLFLIVTTNLPGLAALEPVLGPAGYSRLSARCGGMAWAPDARDSRTGRQYA